MTGAEHSKAAEELIEVANYYDPPEPVGQYIALAQVHATLALAALTAEQMQVVTVEAS